MAQFLKTRTEPVLVCSFALGNNPRFITDVDPLQYYKPWQLHTRDEDTIREQIEETEQTIARETADFEARRPPPNDNEEQPTAIKQDGTSPAERQESGREGKQPSMQEAPLSESEPKKPDQSEEAKRTVTAAAETTTHAASNTVGFETANEDQSSEDPARRSTNQDHRHGHHQVEDVHHDDGGEVVEEDNEDTVIY